MNIFKMLFLTMTIALSFSGCTKNTENKEENNKTKNTETVNQSKTSAAGNFSGNYVDDGYGKKDEGYDWVSVAVKKISDNEISVSVRSRADKKKPTCLFDAKARKVNDNTYESFIEGKKVLYTFKDSLISISTENKDDEKVLYFYCSGGATVAGSYTKLNGSIDETQIDKTIFSKILNLQGVGFNVTTKPKGDKEELVIYPFGLSLDDQTVTMTIDGSVTDAETEDLNSDGFPEIMVYTQTGENKAGNVLGCSLNNKNSMSFFYFPPTSENPKINKGYNGYDEFSVVETSLSQRFPIFENGKETGKIRQVDYKLVNGENGRIFEVKNITEFDNK